MLKSLHYWIKRVFVKQRQCCVHIWWLCVIVSQAVWHLTRTKHLMSWKLWCPWIFLCLLGQHFSGPRRNMSTCIHRVQSILQHLLEDSHVVKAEKCLPTRLFCFLPGLRFDAEQHLEGSGQGICCRVLASSWVLQATEEIPGVCKLLLSLQTKPSPTLTPGPGQHQRGTIVQTSLPASPASCFLLEPLSGIKYQGKSLLQIL